MPLTLNEFVGFDPMKPRSASTSSKEFAEFLQKYQEQAMALKESDKEYPVDMNHGFIATIEAIHADLPTRNYTRYMRSSFKNAAPTWTQPYNIPVIMYHNDYDGQIIGRVLAAKEAASEKVANTTALLLEASIPDWRNSDQVENGILNTVSIGASATDVRCSICGAQLAEGDWCEHSRGSVYKNKDTGKTETCYWDVYEWEAKEISFVIIPSDKYAGVLHCAWRSLDTPVQTDDGTYKYLGRDNRTMTVSASAKHDTNNQVPVQESEHTILKQPDKHKGEKNSAIKEAEQKISSLETEAKALKGDKASLQEKVDSLNKDKISLQESITKLKKEAEEKELAATQEKELREAAESKVENLTKEAKLCLAESLTTLREKAGKKPIEKLEERSIDSLRDSIADLKAELAEQQKKLQEQAEQKEKKEPEVPQKGSVKPTTLQESEEDPVQEQQTEEEPAEDFDL